MTDFLKDYFEAVSMRVKSPILGSIAFAILLANWQPLYYLFFSEMPVSVRLRYFNMNTDWFWSLLVPGVLGAVLAILLPWINFFGAGLIARPLRRHRQLQESEATENSIHRLMERTREEEQMGKFNKARDERIIAEAERQKEADSKGSEVGEELRKDREERAAEGEAFPEGDPVKKAILDGRLTDFDTIALIALTRSQDGVTIEELAKFDLLKSYQARSESIKTQLFLRTKLTIALEKLASQAYVKRLDDGIYAPTERGYSMAEEIIRQFK